MRSQYICGIGSGTTTCLSAPRQEGLGSSWASARRRGLQPFDMGVRASIWALGHRCGRHRSLVLAGTTTYSPNLIIGRRGRWHVIGGIGTSLWASVCRLESRDVVEEAVVSWREPWRGPGERGMILVDVASSEEPWHHWESLAICAVGVAS